MIYNYLCLTMVFGGRASAQRTSERLRGRRAPDDAHGGPVTPASNAGRPFQPPPPPPRAFLPASRQSWRGAGPRAGLPEPPLRAGRPPRPSAAKEAALDGPRPEPAAHAGQTPESAGGGGGAGWGVPRRPRRGEEPFVVPALRQLWGGAAGGGGAATPRWGGEGALGGGAAAPAAARESGLPALRAAGSGPQRGARGGSVSDPRPDCGPTPRRECFPRAVSIPGREGVGAARRPLAARFGRGRAAGAWGYPETSPCRPCGAGAGEAGGEFSSRSACLRDDRPSAASAARFSPTPCLACDVG
ncbi:uncharacterized protein [Manis javanica]|uniref:uncharacterized protein isoform X1 n=1 Tax=Manis javanica TaxID=9974 RepID=UPI00187A7DBD|nr:translation initiation factor IF-2-like isoform X1 [Manis javanica]XP_036847146.1 translation initiation factor IF-2-like isoform X1 [Manis javanica]XP_036847147.1 translation initiation factor IF-2-like isoform X1 [Manis javanica]XP_036847149.1 translation initiation factor IF-2-like isoform X1 [Manis javanica]XP_036847150.1 translation initiation factor IF-2-like isoform X1 [Manis javanica]